MRKQTLVLIAVLFIVGFVLYSFNLGNGLFWDDEDWIILNTSVHSLSWDNVKFVFTHDTLAGIGLRSNYYRPFLFLTFMANYIVGGIKPLLYHLVNNLLHIGNAVFVFLLLDKYLKKRFVAMLASLLFLVHPLQTEAVTYISGRGDPMSVFFMLLALWLFLKANKRILWTAGSLVAAVLAILSRETAFLFPVYLVVFMIAFEYCDENFVAALKKSVIRAWPFFAISVFYGILRLTVLNFQNTLNFFAQPNAYTENLAYRIFTFLHVMTVYLRLAFAPSGLHMERDVLVNTSLWQWPVWLGLLFVLSIIAALFWVYKKKRSLFGVWFFSWGFFFINLAPTSGVFPINAIIYEHWLYFSLFGLFTLAAFYIDKVIDFLKSKSRVVASLALAGLLVYGVFLSAQTIRRNILWGETEAFYQDILKYEPHNVRVLNNLANHYADNGRLDESKDLFWRAIDAEDIQPAPYYNLGNILRDEEDYAGAAELYKKALEIDNSFAFAYINLADIYVRQGNLGEALRYLKLLREARPDHFGAYYNIGVVENALGHRKEAIESLEAGLELVRGDSDLEARFQSALDELK